MKLFTLKNCCPLLKLLVIFTPPPPPAPRHNWSKATKCLTSLLSHIPPVHAHGQEELGLPIKNQKGFSLTEVLVTVGVMAIITAIASVSYNTYMGMGTKSAVKQDIKKLQNSFELCLSMNSYDLTKCHDSSKTEAKNIEKIGFKTGNNIVHFQVVGNKACLEAKATVADNQTGERACAEYTDGKLTKKCFEKKEGTDTTKYTKTGCSGAVCCPDCGATKPASCPVWPASG